MAPLPTEMGEAAGMALTTPAAIAPPLIVVVPV